MKYVLITGITGKSGLYLMEEMIKNADKLSEYNFRVSVRESSNTRLIDEAPLSIEKFIGSLDDIEYLNQLTKLEGDWTLIHIAGISKSLDIVKRAVKNGVKRMILVHTTGIYSKYKAAGEIYRNIEEEIAGIVHGRDINCTILRPTMIYGNLNDKNVSTFIKMVNVLTIFPTVNGAKYELQPVWCGDLGKAYFQVLMHPEITKNKNYNLSGGKPIALIDMFHVIENGLGKKNYYFSVPFWMAYCGAVVLYGLSIGKKDFREKVQRLVEPRVFPHDEASRDFSYKPVDFEVGAQREIEDYLRQKNPRDKN